MKSEKIRKSRQAYRQRPECKAAHLKRVLKSKRRRQDETRGGVCHGKPWREQEIDLLWATGYSTKGIAMLLGRTHGAVSSARERYASKRPSNYKHNGSRRAVFTGTSCEEAGV